MGKNKSFVIYLGLLIGLFSFSVQGSVTRSEFITNVSTQIGVHELTGKNDGARVESYLKSVKLHRGDPWCAAFLSWNCQQCGVNNPMSGYSPAWFPSTNVIYKPSSNILGSPQPGDVFGIYFSSKGRIAHVGFIAEWGEKYVITIEGNTAPDPVNADQDRDGDGVYKKKRLRRQIYAVSSWIN